MTNKPNISIIVPIYNSESYLHRCIDSILAQTYSDFELLLINDGSVDSSGIICDEYAKKDTRIRAFHKKNGGVSSARNIGLDNAIGQWICFADSDDYVNTDWLQIFVEQKDNVDFVIQGFFAYNCRNMSNVPLFIGLPNQVVKGEATNEIIFELQNIQSLGYLWCKMFKRQTIESNNIRFNIKYPLWEDVDFVVSYFSVINSVEIKNEGGYHYLP